MRVLYILFLSINFSSFAQEQAHPQLEELHSLYKANELNKAETLAQSIDTKSLEKKALNRLRHYQALIAVKQGQFVEAYQVLSDIEVSQLTKSEKTTLVIAVNYLEEFGNLPERKLKKLKRQYKTDTSSSPWRWKLNAFAEYSDGIERDEFKNPNIPPEREGRFRLRTSVKGEYKHKLNYRNMLNFGTELRNIRYEAPRSDLDILSQQFKTSWQRVISRKVSLQQEYQFNHFMVGESMSTFLRSHQLESALNYKYSGHQFVRLGLRAKAQNLNNDDLDGESYTALSFYMHQVPEWAMDFILGYQYQISQADKRQFSYRQHLVMAGLKKTFWSDAVFRLNVSYTHSDFLDQDTVQTNVTREDNKWSFTGKYIYPIGAVDLETYFNYTKRRSSLFRHRYNSRMYGIGVVWKFDG